MNRASRRRSIADFRRTAERTEVTTWLVDASDVALSREPFLQPVLHWRSNVSIRKPRCASCRKTFPANDTPVGGYLFASPVNARAISVSSFCVECWSSLSDTELECVAMRVLQRIKPGSKFADAS